MDIERLRDIEKIKVLVFGDYMLDKYVTGKINRISPEAPVPVIEIDTTKYKLGGAGNVVNNIISLGASVKIIGCVGDDVAGNMITENFNKSNVDTSYMKLFKGRKTIIKTRVVSKNQQFMRLDEEKIEELPFEYQLFLEKNIDNIFDGIDSVIISDYGKGSVTEKIAQLLITKSKEKNIPVIVDPKGDDYSKYTHATLCTPNVKELERVFKTNFTSENDIIAAGMELCEKVKFDYLMLTRSEKGISLFDKKSKKHNIFPALAKDVIDVTGAGDTVASTVSILIPLGFPMNEVCQIANNAASVVVSKFGASTVSLNELICNIEDSGKFKLITKQTAKYIVQDLKDKNKKIVFTNGCFDLLHAGHLSSFEKASKYGDILIVAVNSDESVKRIKGQERPIINQKDRISMLCALEYIDYVVLMEDDNPTNLIELLQPNICIKGSDWKNKYMPEENIINTYGGKIEFIDLEKGRSTTNIIDKILKVYGESNEKSGIS